MAFTPVKGKFAKIEADGSPAVVFPAIQWTLPIDGNAQDVSNFRDGRKVMTTLDDSEVTFTLVWDADAIPTDAANGNIRIDADLVGKFYVDNSPTPTRFFSAPLKVTRIEPQNEGPNGRVMMPVICRLNGDITYPITTPP